MCCQDVIGSSSEVVAPAPAAATQAQAAAAAVIKAMAAKLAKAPVSKTVQVAASGNTGEPREPSDQTSRQTGRNMQPAVHSGDTTAAQPIPQLLQQGSVEVVPSQASRLPIVLPEAVGVVLVGGGPQAPLALLTALMMKTRPKRQRYV